LDIEFEEVDYRKLDVDQIYNNIYIFVENEEQKLVQKINLQAGFVNRDLNRDLMKKRIIYPDFYEVEEK